MRSHWALPPPPPKKWSIFGQHFVVFCFAFVLACQLIQLWSEFVCQLGRIHSLDSPPPPPPQKKMWAGITPMFSSVCRTFSREVFYNLFQVVVSCLKKSLSGGGGEGTDISSFITNLSDKQSSKKYNIIIIFFFLDLKGGLHPLPLPPPPPPWA